MRTKEYPCDDLFVNRWSPRAMSGEKISKEELFTLFEAARWAPSSYNGQPWKFIYAVRDRPVWHALFECLGDFNKQWVKNAAVLVLTISRKNFEHNNKPARTHSFDTGSAWMSVALQARMMGLVAHGMEGFDYEKAKKTAKVPDDYTVEMMFAVGKNGKKEDLPAEIQNSEFPNGRKKVNEIAWEGTFHG
ncbi:nitroreductase family protein [Candidatus Woesearchaeota archaeon]|nr:nitroreductase family protein [Candidatus Woesearchaeota archaeon]